MIKLQITLTDEENQLLSLRASILGYDVTKYAKFLLAREAVDSRDEVPVFTANHNMEKAIKEARNESKKGNLKSWPSQNKS
jgi:hypothetical protein